MGTITCVFRDLTANISYRVTFVLMHGYVNSQTFIERIGGQQLWAWQQGGPASFYFGTVTGTTQIQGTLSTIFYGGGGGSISLTNNVTSGPLTITTAGVTVFSSNSMSCWTANFRDLTANISYRATFILQHNYTNSQCFLERMGGQQI